MLENQSFSVEALPIHADSFITLEREHRRQHEHEGKIRQLPRNKAVYERWIRRFCDVEINLIELADGLFCAEVGFKSDFVPNDLPSDYGLIGGTARAILRDMLDLPTQPPRDVDIVFCAERELTTEEYKRVSQQFMPDDFAYGHGVQVFQDDYFATRDFTWNEILYLEGQCIFTDRCLLDTVRNIVRFSDYMKQESYHGDDFFVSPKLMAKAIRFVSEAKAQGIESMRLAEEIEDLQYAYIDFFHMSLHLDRAMTHSEEAAYQYTEEMVSRGLLPETIRTPNEAYQFLLGQTDFVFRSDLARRWDEEAAFVKEEMLRVSDDEQYDDYDKKTYGSVVPSWHPIKRRN